MYPDYRIAKAMQEERLATAARIASRPQRRATPRSPSTGVIDALGNGLIAIGARLVSDPGRHDAPGRRAA
ncbi:MAG TPA: hypothetical protein VK011_07555 [Acidimicrobiia bacterium]|nr:hypothetical protein [Acidimicrobiia bacterium]